MKFLLILILSNFSFAQSDLSAGQKKQEIYKNLYNAMMVQVDTAFQEVEYGEVFNVSSKYIPSALECSKHTSLDQSKTFYECNVYSKLSINDISRILLDLNIEDVFADAYDLPNYEEVILSKLLELN